MTKDEIIREIRRVAEANGGIAPGKQRFLDESGIRESDWSGRYWTRWGDAVREAGYAPQAMNKSLADEIVLDATVRIIRQLGHFPTSAEIRLACRQPDLPSHNTFRRFGGLSGLLERVVNYSVEHGFTEVLALLPAPTFHGVADSTATEASDPDVVDGFVYLLKSGAHYKIGKAMSVESRKRQLAIQLPKPAEEIHRIKTDDPFGIEAYWHRRFATKRLNGEWFSLSSADVKAFRRRRFM